VLLVNLRKVSHKAEIPLLLLTKLKQQRQQHKQQLLRVV
jgi:hypothetical protein